MTENPDLPDCVIKTLDAVLDKPGAAIYDPPRLDTQMKTWAQDMLSHIHTCSTERTGLALLPGPLFLPDKSFKALRAAMVDDDVVEVIVAMPGGMLSDIGIPLCLWCCDKRKTRAGMVLFIDASKLGSKVDKRRVELSDEEIERIGATVAAWRSGTGYADVAGYCQSATLEDIARQNYALTPARYVASGG